MQNRQVKENSCRKSLSIFAECALEQAGRTAPFSKAKIFSAGRLLSPAPRIAPAVGRGPGPKPPLLARARNAASDLPSLSQGLYNL